MKGRVLSLTLTLGLLAACAGQQGIDRTSGGGDVAWAAHSESEGGIGGTGAPLREKALAGGDETEGGIGGTGIFGTVTAFGSIVVNGQTIDFEEADVQSQAVFAGQDLPLTLGSAVLVEARSSEESWSADRLSLFLPLVGPVSGIDLEARVVTMMGTPVVLDEDTALVDRRGYVDGVVIKLDAIRPGDRLAVSGIWKGGEVIASRIDRLEDDGPHSLSGLLLTDGEAATVGGARLDDACCERLAAPAFVRLTGSFAGDRFEVAQALAGSDLLFSEDVDRLIVEAYLARDPDGAGFHLSGFGIPADQASAVDATPGARSLFIGAYEDAFRIQRSLALPDDRSERIEIFRSLDDVALPD